MRVHHLPNLPDFTTAEQLQDMEEGLFSALKLSVLLCPVGFCFSSLYKGLVLPCIFAEQEAFLSQERCYARWHRYIHTSGFP